MHINARTTPSSPTRAPFNNSGPAGSGLRQATGVANRSQIFLRVGDLPTTGAAQLPYFSRHNLTVGNKVGSDIGSLLTGLVTPPGANFTTSGASASSSKVHAMGNGTSGNGLGQHHSRDQEGGSNSWVFVDGEKYDTQKAKHLVESLRHDVRQKSTHCQQLELELSKLRQIVLDKETENKVLRTEIDKLKSVLDLTVKKEDIFASLNTEQIDESTPNERAKRLGVSGESGGTQLAVELKHHEKDFRSKQLIRNAILENDFTKHLDSTQVKEMVECMYDKSVAAGCFIIREGESGQHLYVSAEGELEVIKNKVVLGTMGPGRCFGELALLYNCNRTASVRATTQAKLWTMDRRVFQAIMMKTGLQRTEEHVQFLKSVSLLKSLPDTKLLKIADVLEEDFFSPDQCILREGETGDTFFIIKKGQVQVTQLVKGNKIPQEIRILKKGDYFGEKALLSEDCRTANVIAMQPGVDVLTLDRHSFFHLIGDLDELKEKDYEDDKRGAQRLLIQTINSPVSLTVNPYSHVRLGELDVLATLGMGGFGRVELVIWNHDRNISFALKCLKKKHIVDTRQQDHIYSEKKIMQESDSPFICKLYKTFKDNKYVYMLLEACLGGELWTLLRDRGSFDDHISRFVVGCVLEAFEYLHTRGIIYRDLKPENLLLDTSGYVKLCDFGFAKKVAQGRKTWTFCGTPEYVAPEIILNKGHDYAADYWSLGILMYELLTGTPPFTANDPMKIYNIILKGIDVVEFSKKISRNANSLIKKLCRDNPAERLGYGKGGIADIKKNKFFQGFDWEGLQHHTLAPCIVTTVKGPSDYSNFDNYPRDMEVPQDETSGWDIDF